ncbi:MAG TPA: methylenetetrahydrofolate reductase [NAD(P)H] [Rhodospirillales bacterium]|jgi:methylenetetrahydrofolate reductase (NADPH)|nr:methylenetetrahydrofolate reductase [NAD(P)H] [Rhodospirillales bacterium]
MDVRNDSRHGAARGPATVLAVAAPLPCDVEVSFEFFPPRTEDSERTLWASIQRLAPVRPAYVSVTYGAGGSTRERTHATVMRMLRETDLTPAAHLTCVGHSRGEIEAIAASYWEGGVRHIVALRGDAPEMGSAWEAHPDGYAHASELVVALKKVADFEISVAAYPEKHPEASSLDADIDFLKHKIDAGATRAITQYFFDVDVYLRFVERARARGVGVPIVPGILPVTNFNTVVQFSKMNGVSVPAWLADLFDGLDEEPATRKLIAASVAAEQCRALHANGVEQFHFYTLNRADLAYAICHVLGVRAPQTYKTQRGET